MIKTIFKRPYYSNPLNSNTQLQNSALTLPHADGDRPQIGPDLTARPLYPQGTQHSSHLSIPHRFTAYSFHTFIRTNSKTMKENQTSSGAPQNPSADK